MNRAQLTKMGDMLNTMAHEFEDRAGRTKPTLDAAMDSVFAHWCHIMVSMISTELDRD